MSTNLAHALTMLEELPTREPGSVPSDDELEMLDEAIAEINLQLAGTLRHSVALRDQREELLGERAELRRRRERAGLFEAGELIRFFGIEHVGPVEGNKGQ